MATQLTPKQQTEGLLATTYVTLSFKNKRVEEALLRVLAGCTPGIVVRLVNQERFRNPTISLEADEVMLWTLLETMAATFGGVVEVNDAGELVIREQTAAERLQDILRARAELQSGQN